MFSIIEENSKGEKNRESTVVTTVNNSDDFASFFRERQKYKIACLEEIAHLNGWINKKNIINRINFYGNCSYSKYLKKLIV